MNGMQLRKKDGIASFLMILYLALIIGQAQGMLPG
jgi:hypothetical protein